MENKLPTAKQLLTDNYTTSVYDDNCQIDCSGYLEKDVTKAMIEFAKLHVQEALKQASEKAETIHIRNTEEYRIDKDSILNAYNLDEIK